MIATLHEGLALARLPDNATCNPDEAPAGYYAVPKAVAKRGDANICQQCDWRKACNDPATDLLALGHRCMSTAVVARRDGLTYRRSDRCSVVFKLRPTK
jgi:hypothetical protein